MNTNPEWYEDESNDAEEISAGGIIVAMLLLYILGAGWWVWELVRTCTQYDPRPQRIF